MIPQKPNADSKKMISVCHTPLGYIGALCDEEGLLELIWQQTPITDDGLASDVSRETIRPLTLYLSGELQDFTVPLSPHAVSPALMKWLTAIASVPYGQVVSYAQLAAIWGNAKAARAAGSACQKNPLPIIIPCHRIIGTNGTYDRYSGGDKTTPSDPANIARKKALLDLEAGLSAVL